METDFRNVLKEIYDALSDDISRSIFKHRLLYSLLEDKSEITKIVYEHSPAYQQMNGRKTCFYGAGAGAGWLVKYNTNIPFVIDKYKTGLIEGHPIISLDEFMKMPDCKEYLVIITVGNEKLREEIRKELGALELNFVFAYFDMQYFELQYFDLGNLDLKNEYFVDAGALNGETSKYFLEHFQDGHAYVFEPNPEQYEISKENLKDYSEVEFFPYGLYDQNTTLYFDTRDVDPGSARVSEQGDIEIEVRKLDDLLQDKKVTFIKMDIEGSELAALLGAEKIIREQKPKLAICVYHKPEDIWEIPKLILKYCPDYKLYLRHYSISYTETVLYAVAKKEAEKE